MQPSSLENLHGVFSQALKSDTYLGLSSKDPNLLENSSYKNIRLTEVFKKASTQIEENCKKIQKSDENQIRLLRALKEDGKKFYERYQQSTHSLSRLFLKTLALFTPSFLKPYLPSCFSNQMAEAEVKTNKEYEEYDAILKKQIERFSRLNHLSVQPPKEGASEEELSDDLMNEILDEYDVLDDDKSKKKKNEEKDPKDTHTKGKKETLDDDQKNKSSPLEKEKKASTEPLAVPPLPLAVPPLPSPILPTPEELEKKRNEGIATCLQHLHSLFQTLNKYQQCPLSTRTFKSILIKIVKDVATLSALDPTRVMEHLKKEGVTEDEYKKLSHLELRSALAINNDVDILKHLETTSWHSSFEKAMAQKGHLKFGVNRRLGGAMISLANEDGTRVKENELKEYRGEVHLTIADLNLLGDIEELIKFLKTNDKCRPCTLVIDLKQGLSLTPPLFKHLLALSEYTAEIRVNDLKEIHLKDLALSPDEENQFIQRLDRFHFPNLEKFTFSEQSKNGRTPFEFSQLLSLIPTIEFLKECYNLCSSPQEIKIPTQLSQMQNLDLRGFPLQHLHSLCLQFNTLTELNLSGLAITDALLQQWISSGIFAHLQVLHLHQCDALTTDILPSLISLNRLTTLSLPDLPQGKLPLVQLPSFDNPFKIKLFYTSSKVTQKIASQLYTGPQTWAPLFQIPLAREGIEKIFNDNHRVLDPKSVAYWLYKGDYKNLKPQQSVTTILADQNGELNDQNLVEFLEKFPNVVSLSLYRCPNVTPAGIISALTLFPRIKTLDLTGCKQIDGKLFFNDDLTNLDVLDNLNRLIVTDTSLPSDVATVVQEHMGKKLIFEETVLKITDAQLIDDQSLEALLKAKNLTKLRCVDFSGCTKLTNQMLSQFLDHLNAPIWVNQNGLMAENPQRLNLAILNLTGCQQITDEAFDQQKIGDKIEPKLLENLDCIIIEGTKISKILREVYPLVTFQDKEEPIIIKIDPNQQLQACLFYHELKEKNQNDKDQSELKILAQQLIHSRIAVELFASSCQDQTLLTRLARFPVSTDSIEFFDMALSFKTDDGAQPVVFNVHRDVLYSQSLYFLNRLRSGGMLSKLNAIDFINQHATPQVAKVMIDILYGKANIENLDWEIAAHVAELVGLGCFQFLSTYTKTLLDRIHSQFDPSRAEEMFLAAKKLNDTKGRDEYENTLLLFLSTIEGNLEDSENQKLFQSFVNLAQEFGLEKLKAKTLKIQDAKTQTLLEQEIALQTVRNDRLFQTRFGGGKK